MSRRQEVELRLHVSAAAEAGIDISDLDELMLDGGGLPYIFFNSDEQRIGQNLYLDISSDLDEFELDGGGLPYISTSPPIWMSLKLDGDGYISTSPPIGMSWSLTAEACHICLSIRMRKGLDRTLASTSPPIWMS